MVVIASSITLQKAAISDVNNLSSLVLKSSNVSLAESAIQNLSSKSLVFIGNDQGTASVSIGKGSLENVSAIIGGSISQNLDSSDSFRLYLSSSTDKDLGQSKVYSSGWSGNNINGYFLADWVNYTLIESVDATLPIFLDDVAQGAIVQVSESNSVSKKVL